MKLQLGYLTGSSLYFFRIPHFEQRLKALYYQKGFSERIGDLKPKIECKNISFLFVYSANLLLFII